MSLVNRALAALVALFRAYPARATSIIVAAILLVCARAGLVVPEQSIRTAVEFVLPVLLGGEIVHRNVTPTT